MIDAIGMALDVDPIFFNLPLATYVFGITALAAEKLILGHLFLLFKALSLPIGSRVLQPVWSIYVIMALPSQVAMQLTLHTRHHRGIIQIVQVDMNAQPLHDLESVCSNRVLGNGEERNACLAIDPVGFHLRPPPAPHELHTFITPDSHLFETIHMGSAVVDIDRWQLVIDGLVQRPFTLSFSELRRFPRTTVTAFHECYGSPLTPPVNALWRVGNVTWTGVQLQTLLALAQPLDEARFVWSEGLDYGEFAGRQIDRYQKDLPIEKARSAEVLLAYELNGQPLRKERGGPVRLVVPGWFGTNMTKWVCRISLQAQRGSGPFTAIWYNERDPTDPAGGMRPVWVVEPNSIIVHPLPGAQLDSPEVKVQGWAWSGDGIAYVSLSANEGKTWINAELAPRVDFSWQQFKATLQLPNGTHRLIARATSRGGIHQPLHGRRNHAHSVLVDVTRRQAPLDLD